MEINNKNKKERSSLIAVNDSNNILSFLISTLLFFVIIFQGGYFPYQYLTVSIILCLLTSYILIKNKEFTYYNINTKILILLFTISIIYLLSSFIATNKYYAVVGTIKIWCLLLFFIVTALSCNRELFLKGILIGCEVVAVIGLFAYMGWFSFNGALVTNENTVRLQSVLQYANITAVMMGIGYFISIYFIQNSKNIKEKLKYFLYGFLFLICMMLTFSRGALLVFLIIFILMLTLLRSLKITVQCLITIIITFALTFFMDKFAILHNYELVTLLLLIGFGIIICTFFTIEKFQKHLKTIVILLPAIIFIIGFLFSIKKITRYFRISIFEGTLVERYIYVTDALTAIKNNLLFGIGPDNWISQQFFYQTAGYYTKYIHTGIIQIALDAGIIAVFMVIAILIIYYKKCISKIRQTECNNFYICSFCIVTFIVLHSMIDIDLSMVSILMILGGLFALSTQGTKSDKAILFTKKIQNKFIFMPIVVFIFIISGIYLTGQILSDIANASLKLGNIENTLKLCTINKFFKPLDSENYVLIGKTLIKQCAEKDKIINCFNKAYLLDPYNKECLYALITYYENINDYSLAYDTSIKLINIDPLNNSNYEMTFNQLNKMYKDGLIDKNTAYIEAKRLIDLSNEANSKINSLAVFLKNQKQININTDYLK